MAENVVPMMRPPIKQSVLVPSGRQHTFEVFTQRLADWWPLVPFSSGGGRVSNVTLDPRVGGRVIEVWEDGSQVEWGELLAWTPPEAFAMTWNITGTPTEVELRFLEMAPSLTRVELEHRGWERLSEDELLADCGIPGGYVGGAFTEGWHRILTAFKKEIES
jgi:hypothetical protein